MEYMESKMQDYYDAGEALADELFVQMIRFENFYLSLPDADESLLDDMAGHFDYRNGDVQSMWVCFKAGAGY